MIPTFSTWLFNRELGEKKMKFDEALRFARETAGAVAVEIPRTTYADWSMPGVRVLNVFHAGWGDREQGRRLKAEMLECMKDAVAYAERKAVILAVEAHGPITDNADEFCEFMAACPSEYLRVNLDTGNMQNGPEDNLKLIEFTAHVHVKGTYRDAAGQTHDAQNKRVLTEVKKTGYCGTVTCEYPDQGTAEEKAKVFADFKKLLASL